MTFAERRVSERVPARFKVNYVHHSDYLISFTRDISADGMFIYTENPPSIGENIELNFAIGDLREVTVTAMVVWVNAPSPGDDSGVGVRFIDPDPLLSKEIMRVVNRVAVLDER